MSLIVKNLYKSYKDKCVVNNISFTMEKPKILGLLGTNGAGKTTTIRMILNILNKDSGLITWKDKFLDEGSFNFGYLPEERGLYPRTKIYDQIIYFANLKKLDKKTTEEEINYWFNRLNITEYKYSLPSELSKGNQQKVQLVIALLGNPELIVLDEPFSGLDPVNTELLKSVINELAEKKKYIILSSHQMNMIESFCEEIVIIDKGVIVCEGNLLEIKKSYNSNKVLIETNTNIEKLLKNNNYKFEKNNNFKYIVECDNKDLLLKLLINENVDVDKFNVITPSLQEIFLDSVGDNLE